MNRTEIQVDQALHGYADGHRLVASSVKLEEADARMMLVLSDASTARFIDPSRGILTGYPLPNGSRYVLARTWPAPEMPRPGCVWTHSLLVGFADLATIGNVSGLLALFRRPAVHPNGYDVPLKPSGTSVPPTSLDSLRAPALLNALYLEPIGKVELPASQDEDDEALILAVWMQQWPRLRRSFRFCSMVGADRSTSTESFDLQVAMPLSPGRRSTISGARVVGDEPIDPRLVNAAEDLRRPNGLRAFLRLAGGDVPRGRAAMASLCQLYDALGQADRGEVSYSVALDAFEALGSRQARAARKIVVDHALENIGKVDDRTFQFILSNAVETDTELESPVAATIGEALWKRSPSQFTRALSDPGRLGFVATSALQTLPVESLARGVGEHPAIAAPISLARPDVLQRPEFWSNRLVDVGAVLQHFSLQGLSVPTAIMSAGRADAAWSVVQQFGIPDTLSILNSSLSAGQPVDVSAWLDCLASDPAKIAGPLASGVLSRPIVIGLASRVRPDDLPNDYGDDPWANAARATGSVSPADEMFFAAFLMARALGRRSRSKAALFQMTFDRVHSGLADGSMPNGGWQIIEPMLPWPMPWGEWDRCGRIREAVTESFVDNGLDPAVFGWVTMSGPAFEEMARIASRSRSGRAFLERVRKAIQGHTELWMQARVKFLKKLI